MLQTLINAFKVKEIRKKVYMMLLLLLIFRIGCYIPVPGLDRGKFSDMFASGAANDYLQLMSSITGGALAQGTIFALGDANGTWSKANTFDTIAEAQAYLNACFTGTTETYTVIYNSNGGTGIITSVEVTAGSSITLDTGASLTRSSYTFKGWATTPTATTPNVTSPYTPTGDVTLYAVWDSE